MNSNILTTFQVPPLPPSPDNRIPFRENIPQPLNTPAHLLPHQKNNRLDRPMYSSTIQTPTASSSPSSGLAGLDSMGRVVKEQLELTKLSFSENSVITVHNQTKPLTFRTDRGGRAKMASSSIFTSNNTQTSDIYAPNQPPNSLQALMANRKITEVEEKDVDQPREERRKRQILSFRQQGDLLNKKMESTFGKKQGEGRMYFQLPTRRNQTQQAAQVLPPTFASNNVTCHNIEPSLTQGSNPIQINFSPTLPASGMFKKKNPIMQTLQPPQQLAKSISIKAEKVIKKFTKNDFAVGRKMGKGQFGEVMMVIHKQTGFMCGMKIMSKKQIREEKYVNQIARELSIQFYLSHRYIAPLYGYFQDQENVYLLVEFCTDGQLMQKMRKSHRLEESETSPIIREVIQGLDFIHREQILHRDIKPENILFQFGTVKISDFGWAVHSGNQMRKTISGTPLYYSPELVLSNAYDQKIDIWSIGMMTYECIIGKIPFRIYSEFDLNRIVEDEITFPDYVDVTEETKDFILRTMRKKPEERMELRQMMRHPFITKYTREKKVDDECLKLIKRVLD